MRRKFFLRSLLKNNLPFQKMSAQCFLNAGMAIKIPLCSKNGEFHLSVSVTSGHFAWMSLRRRLRIGFAKSADLAM